MEPKKLRGQKGVTLVELIVCAALVSIFAGALAATIGPTSKMFLLMQTQNQSQIIANTVIDTLRGELLDAQGPVRFCTADTTGSDVDKVFGAGTAGSYNAVEFKTPGGFVEVVDAGALPAQIAIYKQTTLLETKTPANALGRLHMRYYKLESDSTTSVSSYYYYKKPSKTYIARAFTEAFDSRFYLANSKAASGANDGGYTIQLAFTPRFTDGKKDHYSGADVTVRVYTAAGQLAGSQQAVLDFDNKPAVSSQSGAKQSP